LNKSTSLIFTEEDKKNGIPMRELQIARDTGCCEDERWHLRKDGSRFFMSGVTNPVTHNGSLLGYVKITRNITKRKLVEEALVLADQENLIALQSTSWGELDYDIVSDNVTVSREGRSILGIADDQGIFKTSFFLNLLHPDDVPAFSAELQKCLDGLNIFHHICRIFRADSHDEAWINLYGRVVASEDGVPKKMVGVIHDVSVRKFLEQQKESFIGVVSHELKTPVTSIKLYTQVLQEQFENAADHENTALIKKLHMQVDSLTDLIYTLLDFSAVSSGNIPLHPEECNLNDLITETINELQLSFPRHELVFKANVISSVHADKIRIKQVLVNLITNAVKYSPGEKQVLIMSQDQGDGALIQVQDFGIGIAAEDRRKIFSMFYRGVESKTKGFSGFGIGLYISSKIIHQHHGQIGVESIQGKGSTFYFKIPYS
jgi:two-component system CheB/CheR fusion protein